MDIGITLMVFRFNFDPGPGAPLPKMKKGGPGTWIELEPHFQTLETTQGAIRKRAHGIRLQTAEKTPFPLHESIRGVTYPHARE